MTRFLPLLHRLLLPLLGVLAFGLAGCSDSEHVNSATELDEPNYREGQTLLKTGRRQEALAAFLKVISKRGDDAPESHLEIGLLYLQHINDPLSAIYHFKKYLALRPNSPQAPLVKQRIDAATREFARTLPAQPLEGQPQRVDLVAALDRLKQENDGLKQELADLKAGRNAAVASPVDEPAITATVPAPTPAPVASAPAFTFSVDTMPTVKTRAATLPSSRLPLPTVHTVPAPAPARAAPAPAQSTPAQVTPPATAQARATAGRKHVVRPGDSLSKISMQYYGNRTRVHDIFALNRNVMKSETDLKVGMEIKLP
jgi:tetratricopeptide (TPR) repeat protein